MKSFRTAIATHLDYFVFLRLRVSTISEGTYYLQKRRLLRPIFCFGTARPSLAGGLLVNRYPVR